MNRPSTAHADAHTNATRPLAVSELALALNAAALTEAACAGRDAPGGNVRAAKAYAALGLRVLPLHHRLPDGACSCGDRAHRPGKSGERNIAKHPLTHHGFKDATRSNTLIESWFWGHPLASVAVATGHLVDVIDVDHGAALVDVLDLIAVGVFPQPLASVRTGRDGGVHLWVPATGRPSWQRYVDGVDYRGTKGYVVVPPSIHRSGVRYEWSPFLSTGGDAERGGALVSRLPRLQGWTQMSGSASGAGTAEKALQVQKVRVASTGAGARHDAALSAGRALAPFVAEGALSEQEVVAHLRDAYRRSGGSDETDFARAVRDSLAFGIRSPLKGNRGSTSTCERPPMSAREAIDLVRADLDRLLAGTSMPREFLSPARRVMVALLDRCEAKGIAAVRVSTRDVMVWGRVAAPTASNLLAALTQAGLLAVIREGSRDRSEAALVMVCPPASPEEPRGASSGGQSLRPTEGHRLWGMQRGRGHGLTSVDHDLLLHLPSDGETAISIADWAQAAGVSRETVSRLVGEAKPNRETLASLGLVRRAGRGLVQATEDGAVLASAVQGHETLDVLDYFANKWGLDECQMRRVGSVALQREAFDRQTLLRIVERILRGEAAAERWKTLARQHLPVGYPALGRLLVALDSTSEPRAARSVVARWVRAVADGKTPGEATTSSLRAWLAQEEDRSVRLDGPGPLGGAIVSLAADLHLSQRPVTPVVNAATGEVLDAETVQRRRVALAMKTVTLDAWLSAWRVEPRATSRAQVSAPMVSALRSPHMAIPGYAPVAGSGLFAA